MLLLILPEANMEAQKRHQEDDGSSKGDHISVYVCLGGAYGCNLWAVGINV